ncbi:MAG TPA: PQQ-dependent sugar dehydrogenase [Nitrososphaeraceae archaeon]|nr:PQQ-dependent sugar dehydrogenase [Nitrososphaeraceae archaeon]
MNNTLSQVIFGVGIVLAISALAAIFISSISLENENLQSSVTPPTTTQSVSLNENETTSTKSSSKTNNVITSINIAQGSAAEQVTQFYDPNPAGISDGSKITWINNDITMHTATASDGSFDTGLIQAGSSGSAIVKGKGNIPYSCTLHPWMKASLNIAGSNTKNNTESNIINSNAGALETNASTTEDQSQSKSISVPTVNDTNLKVTPIISGLSMPTTMAFLGPDDFLVLQKGGTVMRITNGTISNDPLLNVTVPTELTQGMLGITTSKNSKLNTTYVFLYYTEGVKKPANGQNQTNVIEAVGNRVYRYELVDDKLVNPLLLLKLPAKQNFMDNGGYLRIGPDNNLYLTVGAITGNNISDVETLTQNFVNGTPVDGRAGILRITQDGDSVLNEKGNGLLGDSYPLNLYYGYGLKDSFGIDFDPITGNLWDAEPGRFISDEINMIEPGFNGGFEALQGQSIYVPAAAVNLVDFNGTGKYRDPEFVWTQKIVPVGLKFLTSNKLGEKYQNDLFVGSFLNGKIYHFDLTDDRNHLVVPDSFVNKQMATWNSTGAHDITFGEGFGGISSLNVGPDGYLYVISFTNGVIYKIMPTQ